MKRWFGLFAMLLLSTPGFAADKTIPLPRDSVYQLAVPLTNQHGKRSDWGTRRGKAQLVAMFYTSCQYICPLIIDGAKAVEKELTPAERARLGILLISMDPVRDTPAVLKAVADKRQLDASRWTLASPTGADVRTIAGVLGTRYRALADGEFNHTSALILLDQNGRILARTEKMGGKVDPEFMAQVHTALKPGK